MRLIDKMVEHFTRINRRMKRWQRVVSVLSAIVVFVTTYALILPAITLDKATATTQEGIEIAENENDLEESGTAYESEAEEETPDEEEVAAVEESSAESNEQEAEEEISAEEEDASDPAEQEETDLSVDEEQENADTEEEDADNAPDGNEETESASSEDEDSNTAPAENEDAGDTAADSEGSETASTETEEAVTAATEEKADEIELITENTQLVYEGEDYFVYADFDASAELPVGVVLDVKEITRENDPDTYEFYYEKSLEQMQDKYDENTGIAFARFYDITFKYEGVEVEPHGDVKVRIEYKESVEVEEETKVDAVHFETKDENEEPLEEEKAVVLDENKVETERTENTVEAVEFESSKFSVYGLLGTETLTTKYITADGDTYTITVTYEPKANIPAGAELEVSEITSDTDQYGKLYDKAADAVLNGEKGSLSFARFFDISITKDGEKVQPEVPVDVKIEFAESVDAKKENGFNAVHITEEQTDVIPVTVEPKDDKVDTVEFSAESFSIYGVTYTVDFTYEVDGKNYAFSLPGGGYVSFEALMEVLGVAKGTADEDDAAPSEETVDEEADDSEKEDAAETLTDSVETTTADAAAAADTLTINDVSISEETKDFVADVANVEFSNPELVWIGKVEEDSSVGGLKEANGLECQYSAKLTEEQIAEINAQMAAAGDWALISVKPFLSEEKLTVTMNDGEVFTITVKDGQLHTYAISASGDKYEIIVTYDDTAGIPEDAKLEVREITADTKEYTENVDKVNQELTKDKDKNKEEDKEESPISNPVQFDISIMSGGVKVEPKEGSIVNVEIRLAQSLFGEQNPQSENVDGEMLPNGKKDENTEKAENTGTVDDTSLENAEAQTYDTASNENKGELLFGGQKIDVDCNNEVTGCKVAHITDDGKVDIISEMQTSVADQKLIVEFTTESFSDYMLQPNNNSVDLNSLPDVIYVGDEIYMQNCADYWVTAIGSVVSETKHNNRDDYKVVRATNEGYFRICHRNDWHGGDTYGQGGKVIHVLPKRQGTNPPRELTAEDGIISNDSIGLTFNLFDYDLDEYLDDRFNNYDYGGDNPATSAFVNYGINNGHALKFWGSGIGTQHGELNHYVEHGVTSIVDSNLSGGTGGYPKLSGYNETLEYLFSPSDGTDKKYYGQPDGLFRKEDDYYVYDSNKNYAFYNGSRFVVYDGTYNQKERKNGGEQATVFSDKKIGFFPFHPWDEDYDLFVNWNKNLNHHFGLSMSVDFALPQAPKAVKDTKGEDIIFEFSGDDDMWVFIDGKLAMDIGGIHQPTDGKINFTTKEVVVNGQNQTGFNFDSLYDGNKHTLQVFYVERGGCDSNCKIKFNITRYGDVDFTKVDKDDQTKPLQGAVFGLYRDAACTTPLMENLNNGSSSAFISKSDTEGKVHFDGIPLGTYYLKEIWAPEGYPIDTTVHKVVVYLDPSGRVKAKTTIDGVDAENPGVKITNKHPEPIDLGLKKEWKNTDNETISAPSDASATFEIKRIRSYETYEERPNPGQGADSSKLTVGWTHNGKNHIYKEYDLVSGTTATVSWSYANGYTGRVGCVENGTEIIKSSNPNNIYSEAVVMPSAGQTASLFIIDDSETGESISNINVSGDEFIGGSGGGVIHHFETKTEPDSSFSYDGENVTNNQITLPFNGSWEYNFTDLPLVGNDNDHVYRYTYYLEEVSSTSPEGTTVAYKDTNGNEINKPSDAETSETGTLTITNRVPTGYLRIDKTVTYNGVAPSTDAQKSALAGTYSFKVYTDENCSVPYRVKKGVDDQATWEDLTLSITIANDGTSKSSETVKIPIGNYWIEEQNSEQNPLPAGVTPEVNRIPVTVTADTTTDKPAIASFINNKTESDGPDELTIELEKTFIGLPDSQKIPGGYQAALQYKKDGETVTVDLTGSSQGNVTCTKSSDGMTWHWRVTNIPNDATDFKVFESNYNITGYTRVTKINGKDVENPGQPTSVSVIVPDIEITELSRADYTTTDKQKVFGLTENQILLVRMTSQATVVVSQKSLSYSTRLAIEKLIRDNGGKIPGDSGAQAEWVMNFVYFSHEVQGDSFSYGGRTIFFDGNEVRIPHNSSSHEVRGNISISSVTKENSFTIENAYTEVPTDIDVLKVEKGKETTTQLSGAVFELRQLQDVAPSTPGGQLTYVEDENHQVIVTTETTGDNGRLTFGGLTYGYYEIKEKTPPQGFVLSEDVVIYLKVDGGAVTHLTKGTGKPSTWTAGNDTDTVKYIAKQGDTNTTFSVGNTPGAELPSAGGPGTILYTLGGIALILASALMYGFRLRRRERRFK